MSVTVSRWASPESVPRLQSWPPVAPPYPSFGARPHQRPLSGPGKWMAFRWRSWSSKSKTWGHTNSLKFIERSSLSTFSPISSLFFIFSHVSSIILPKRCNPYNRCDASHSKWQKLSTKRYKKTINRVKPWHQKLQNNSFLFTKTWSRFYMFLLFGEGSIHFIFNLFTPMSQVFQLFQALCKFRIGHSSLRIN